MIEGLKEDEPKRLYELPETHQPKINLILTNQSSRHLHLDNGGSEWTIKSAQHHCNINNYIGCYDFCENYTLYNNQIYGGFISCPHSYLYYLPLNPGESTMQTWDGYFSKVENNYQNSEITCVRRYPPPEETATIEVKVIYHINCYEELICYEYFNIQPEQKTVTISRDINLPYEGSIEIIVTDDDLEEIICDGEDIECQFCKGCATDTLCYEHFNACVNDKSEHGCYMLLYCYKFTCQRGYFTEDDQQQICFEECKQEYQQGVELLDDYQNCKTCSACPLSCSAEATQCP